MVLRRYNKTQSFIQCGDILIDLEARDVIKNGEHIVLTRKEFDILVMFAQNPNTAIFREQMFERIWETDYIGETRTLDSHVQRLRKKLGWQDRIKTVHKIGYKLEIPEEEK